MNNRSRGFLTGVLMLTLIALMVLPAAAYAQRGQRRAARQELRVESGEDAQIQQQATQPSPRRTS